MQKAMGMSRAVTFAWALAFIVAAALAFGAPAQAMAGQGDLAAGSTVQAQATKKAAKQKPAKVAFKKSTVKMNVNNSKGWLVPDGTYYFALAKDTTKVVGQNGIIANKRGVRSQAWKIEFDYNSQCYTITNASSGKVLAVDSSMKNGAKLFETTLEKRSQVLSRWEGIPNFTVPIPSQRWKLKGDKSGYYFVSASDDKKVIDFSGKRARLMLTSTKGLQNHFWFIGYGGSFKRNGIGNGMYTLKSASSKGFMNIARSRTAVGASVRADKGLTLWGKIFEFVHVKDGYYQLVNYNSGLVLTEMKGRIYQTKYSKSKHQMWKPVIVGADGAVQIINRKSGRALAARGKLVVPKKANAAMANQRWYINPTTTGLTTVGRKALYIANRNKSATDHMIVLDMTPHEYFLFHKAIKTNAGAPWTLADSSRCSTGRPGHMTWAGIATTSGYEKHRSGIPATWVIYVTRGSWIHSIVNYGPQGDNQLGWNISAACIRLPMPSAEYVFKNTRSGTTIIRYY